MKASNSPPERSYLKLSLEILLIQMIIFFLLWFWDDYMAKFLTSLVVALASAVLLISLIMELIERSKVPRFYFVAMLITIVAPLIVYGIVLVTGFTRWGLM